MRVIISESQYKILKESKNKKAITAIIDQMGLHGASEFLGVTTYELIEMGLVEHNIIIKIIDQMGLHSASEFLDIPVYRLIEMGVVKSYDGDLYLDDPLVKSLGNLEKVGGCLDLQNTPIESLGNLKYVGGTLYIRDSSLIKLSDKEIRDKINVLGNIYRD
jgi:hypothetical protein